MKWDKNWHDLAQKNIAKGVGYRHRKRLAFKLLAKRKIKGNLLDIGCGDGTAFNLFNKNDFKFFGLDNSAAALKAAKINFPEATYFLGDPTKADFFLGQKFELITCFDALEEVKADERLFNFIFSHLNQDGYFLFTTQHQEKYRTKYDDYAGNVRRYGRDEIISKLAKAGLTVRELITWGYPLYTFYYKNILTKANPDKQWLNKPKQTSFLLNILYKFLFFDDLFIGNANGRILIGLARKNKKHDS